MFEKFKDYMYYLLHYPLKNNKLYILFTVLGSIFDQIKETMFEIRKQSNTLTATGKYLDICGKDRNMARLTGEDDESFRRRLSMKVEIAKRAGTYEGMKLALAAIGYENSRIEPVYLEDADRWAEFAIYLSGKEQSCIYDLKIIVDEIMKVKQASAKPSFGITAENTILIETELRIMNVEYPICNVLICGVYPDAEAIGKNFDNVVLAHNTYISYLENNEYRCNTFNSEEE